MRKLCDKHEKCDVLYDEEYCPVCKLETALDMIADDREELKRENRELNEQLGQWELLRRNMSI